MSITTTRALTSGESEISGTPSGPTPFEPAILQRERAVLRQILRLVAERAEAEAKVEGDRTAGSIAPILNTNRHVKP